LSSIKTLATPVITESSSNLCQQGSTILTSLHGGEKPIFLKKALKNFGPSYSFSCWAPNSPSHTSSGVTDYNKPSKTYIRHDHRISARAKRSQGAQSRGGHEHSPALSHRHQDPGEKAAQREEYAGAGRPVMVRVR